MGDPKYSLINLGDFSKPANTLIKKISAAIGGLYKPFQIRRVAQAEADADKIQAVAQIEITELQHRAISRLFAEEAKKQHNIEAITLKALPDVGPAAKPEEVEDDWIANFFDKCRLISDEEMQSLWARILAGEANSPGKFSKRTVNVVGSLDKLDAVLFSQLCSFVLVIGNPTPLVFNLEDRTYTDAAVTFGNISHLESTGLIHFDAVADYYRTKLEQKNLVHYFGQPVWIEFPDQRKNYRLTIGHVIFTRAGQELMPLCGAQPREGFVEYVKEHWKKFGVRTEQTIQSTPGAG